MYCTCGVGKDTCTGHFYTLASCNVNGCGMPAATRKRLGELIDQGLTDKQIFAELRKEHEDGEWNKRPVCAGCREWHRP